MGSQTIELKALKLEIIPKPLKVFEKKMMKFNFLSFAVIALFGVYFGEAAARKTGGVGPPSGRKPKPRPPATTARVPQRRVPVKRAPPPHPMSKEGKRNK